MHEVRGALSGQCMFIIQMCSHVGIGLVGVPVDFGEKGTSRAEFSWERQTRDMMAADGWAELHVGRVSVVKAGQRNTTSTSFCTCSGG